MSATDPADRRLFVAYAGLKDFGIQYSRVHLNHMVENGQFPAPVLLSANRVAWRISDLLQWAENRPVARSPDLRPMQRRAQEPIGADTAEMLPPRS